MGVGLNFVQRINPAWFLAGAAFFLPIKPAPVNLFLLLALLSSFTSANIRARIADYCKHPVCVTAFVLVSYLYLTALFSSSDWKYAGDYATKYLRLLFLPVVAAILSVQHRPSRILDWFSLGVLLSVIASYSAILGLIESDVPTYFKAHLTHNFFVAVGCAWAVYRIFKADEEMSSLIFRLLVGIAVLISLVNLFVFIPGRSGWITVFLIPSLIGFRYLGFKRGLLLAVALGLGAIVLFLTVDVVKTRVLEIFTEFELWSQGSSLAKETSFGTRMLYWTISGEALLANPWFGYGLGGVFNSVTEGSLARNFEPFPNPHNQYLLLMLQGGLVALFLYFLMIWAMLKSGTAQIVIWVTVGVYLINNLINSFHYDFAESLLFVFLVGLGLAQELSDQRAKSSFGASS